MLHAAELGKSCGATVVGLTQVGKNNLAQIADYTITTVSEETIFRSEAASMSHLGNGLHIQRL